MINNNDKLIQAFVLALGIDSAIVTDDLAYNSIINWDSAAHMVLIVELEKAFDVLLDTDDILDMSSVGRAREILTKYEVVFE